MSFVISNQAYGKSRVRLSRVRRLADYHEISEFTVEILLDGDFETAYTQSDNSKVVPTDTVKNTVFALGRKWEGDEAEEFAMILSEHFLSRFSHIDSVQVFIVEHLLSRVVQDGKPHPHAFVGGSKETKTCLIKQTRSGNSTPIIESGIDSLFVLKTTESGFSDFHHDEFTTLKDTNDRIFATSISASWVYDSSEVDFRDAYDCCRAILIRESVERFSPSVQATLYEMGTSVLQEIPAIKSISLRMPNQHRLLVDLTPFELDNPNLVFVATDEPHGTISATICRQS
jgi:urate oxidase